MKYSENLRIGRLLVFVKKCDYHARISVHANDGVYIAIIKGNEVSYRSPKYSERVFPQEIQQIFDKIIPAIQAI